MNRRTRIKGIANIPVRRKTETTSINNIQTENVISSDASKTDEEVSILKSNESIENKTQNISELDNVNNKIDKTESFNNFNSAQKNISNNLVNDKECQNITSPRNNITSENKNEANIKAELNTEPKLTRRWIPKPKPMVANPSMLRRPKPVLITQKEVQESGVNQNIENENPINTSSTASEIKNLTENTVVEVSEIKELTSTESILKSPERQITVTNPLSPNKLINRARIRPSPKLIRRNSIQGSASESEDDGKRTRTRNDSICSTTTESTSIKEKTIISKDKILSIKVHKLCRKSEQSKRVAEARKDFYQKFGSCIPDKKRLTMMDLIYYNPITNPMPPKKTTPPVEEIIEDNNQDNEEVEDDPDEPEEDSNPVPQVKVGPNGEIILDEQSLVIEQTGLKKDREKLANSQVVNIDDDDRAYGIFKRPKRSKDWTTVETLRFYRTLNTVGTDFSLMVSLFPGRTRRDLKMKFKKEEKINMQLIDKALKNPLNFDLSELEKQSKEEEKLLKNLEKKRKRKYRKTSILANRNVLASEINDDDDSSPAKTEQSKRNKTCRKIQYSDEDQNTSSESDAESEILKKRSKPISEKVRLTNRDSIETNKNDVVNILLREETNKIVTSEQTVSTENLEIVENAQENVENNEIIPISSENEQNCALPNILPNDLSTVEPGSLMILSSLGSDGQQVYKVFMVTPGQNKVPVNLSEDVVQSLTTNLGSAQAVTLDLPVITESESHLILSDVT